MKIEKSDIKTFLLGAAFVAIALLIYDWNDFSQEFSDGFNAYQYSHKK